MKLEVSKTQAVVYLLVWITVVIAIAWLLKDIKPYVNKMYCVEVEVRTPEWDRVEREVKEVEHDQERQVEVESKTDSERDTINVCDVDRMA